MGGKWLEHLKEVAPALTRAMVLLHPDIAANFEFYRAAQAAGTALRINVDAVHVRGAADIQRAVSALAGELNAGVLVLPNPASASHRELLASLSVAHRVPSIAGFRYYVESGVLISYGPEMNDRIEFAAVLTTRVPVVSAADRLGERVATAIDSPPHEAGGYAMSFRRRGRLGGTRTAARNREDRQHGGAAH